MSSTRRCRKCGAAMPEGDQFCTSCGTPSAFRPPVTMTQEVSAELEAGTRPKNSAWTQSASLGNSTRGHERHVKGIGLTPSGIDEGMNGIALAHGEVVKRVYELGRVQRIWGWVEGTLVVTDVRVLYRAEAKNRLNTSTLNKEIHLKDVRGVGLATRRGMSAAGLGAWLLGAFLSFLVVYFFGGALSVMNSFGAADGSDASWGWLVFFILVWATLCIAVLLVRRRASLVALTILSSEVDSAPISVTGVVGKSGGHGFLAFFAGPLILLLERLGIIEADAAAESAEIESVRQVYAELGAVVLDLQSRGALGGA